MPKFTVIIGGSFGAGNYGMCGRAYSPALPLHLAERAHLVMGGEQAAAVLATVRRDASKRSGESWSEDEEALQGADPRSNTRRRAIPITPRARLWDDGIIDPAETRDVLGLAISAAA